MRPRRNAMAKRSSRLDVLLHKQAEIEAAIESLKTFFCVMRCDMCGSVPYYDTHGDAAGLRLVTAYFELAIPIVERMGGWVVRTIGDEILVHFVEVSGALKASLQILSAVARFNEPRTPAHQIHTKVSLHCGTGFVAKGDIYGDVVNVAARIASANSEPDTILVSQDFIDSSSGDVRASFMTHSTATVRGKTDTLTLYKYVEPLAPDTTPDESLVRERLVRIAGEPSATRADRLLRELLSNLRNHDSELLRNEPLPAAVFISQILAELARVATSRELRAKYWGEAFRAARNGWDKDRDIAIADAAANVAVDCFQDEFNSTSDSDRTYQLREARRVVDDALRMQVSAREKASLFGRKEQSSAHHGQRFSPVPHDPRFTVARRTSPPDKPDQTRPKALR
jgi:class 3 adenylate cyclase